MTKLQKSDLPFGSEFSPNQINLPELLQIIGNNSGNKQSLEQSLKQAFFKDNKTSDTNKSKLAMNLRLSLESYQILDQKFRFTDFGLKMFKARNDIDQLHRLLARHILLNLQGLNLVQCIQDMHSAGENVTLVALRKWLEERGIHFPRGGKHASMMRLWLEKAGVFEGKWRINETRLKEIAGLDVAQLDALAELSPEQRAFIKAIANQEKRESYLSNEVEKLASAVYGAQFNEKNLPKTVLYPLRNAGLIKLERGTKQPGRGAKPFLIFPTDRLKKEVISPVLEQLEKQVQSDLRPMLRKPTGEILAELDTENNNHKRGLALEALAFKIMRSVDLDYVATRLRGRETGGAEVDLIFESSRLVFSRWQVQCKNSASVRLDDLAKEVGLTHLLKTNVIVMIGTGKIGESCRNYARTIMAQSNLAIVMMDRNDVERIIANPVEIVDVLNREAKFAMKIKKLEL